MLSSKTNNPNCYDCSAIMPTDKTVNMNFCSSWSLAPCHLFSALQCQNWESLWDMMAFATVNRTLSHDGQFTKHPWHWCWRGSRSLWWLLFRAPYTFSPPLQPCNVLPGTGTRCIIIHGNNLYLGWKLCQHCALWEVQMVFIFDERNVTCRYNKSWFVY
jgi:hypothetical protein